MPVFRYEGFIGDNEYVEGSVEADDAESARARLLARRTTPLRLWPDVPARIPPAEPPGIARPVEAEAPGRRGVAVIVSRRVLARFYRQMASFVHSGVAITESVAYIRDHTLNARMRRALEDMEASVAAGRPLSEAMARHPDVFSPGQTGFVRASEGGGFLDAAFAELAAQAEADWGAEAAGRYNVPLVMLRWVLFPFLAGWIVFMGGAASLTQPGGIEASLLRGFLAACGAAVVLGCAGPVLGRLHRRTALGRSTEAFLLGLPGVGARFRRVDRVRAVTALAHALRAGVPLSVAWDLAAEAPDSDRARRLLSGQAWRVRGGQSLSEALSATGLFEADFLRAVRAGELSGDLPEMLAHAIRYDREEAAQMATLTPRVAATIAYFLYLLIGTALVLGAYGLLG